LQRSDVALGNVIVRRPARLAVPEPGTEPIVIAAPPQVTDPPALGTSAAMIVMPLASGAGSLLITLTNANRPLFAAAGLLCLVASVAFGVVMFVSARTGARRRLREQRERYLDYVEDVRRTLRNVTAHQREAAALRHPEPGLLLGAARLQGRRWERRAGDPDFLELRIGTGVRPLARPLQLQVTGSEPLIAHDPVGLGIAQQLVARYGHVASQPLAVSLAGLGTVCVVGNRATGRQLARTLLAQLVTFHAPGDVSVAVVRHPQLSEWWDWVKWLPHNLDEQHTDGPLPSHLVADSTFELAEVLADEFEQRREDRQRRRGRPPGPGSRRLVIVVDGEYQTTLSGLSAVDGPAAPVSFAELGVHVIVLVGSRAEEPETVDERLVVGADATVQRESDHARVDDFDVTEATALARELCPLRLYEQDASDLLYAKVGLADILGVDDVTALDVRQTWLPRPMRDFLRVPIGVGTDGAPVSLDLKESAFGGMGPHGLVVGATGSGKSEMLRTLVSSLVIGHSPDQLALLLVDFKGGATFADLRELPHLAGMITNLVDDLGLVDRFREALAGELVRRQELLKAAGNLPNLHAYARLRRDHPDPSALPPLPHLLVIIDEFSELLAAKPEFAEVFVAVGRIGRSIGVHLLLATQRLELGRIRGLESHLSYRIGLRTFSEGESREAIGLPDAYHLPPEPGSGFLKVDTTVLERFKAAMVSQPHRQRRESTCTDLPLIPYPASNGSGALAVRPAFSGSAPAAGPSVLQAIVARLAAAGADPVRPVWLPPLQPSVPLDTVYRHERDTGKSVVLLGLEDAPREQRQTPLTWDFTGAEGNLVVVGGPQAGKSMLLRTMMADLALRYAPGEVACYCVDYGGGSLTPLAALPHVAGVATRAEPDRVRRTISDVNSLLDQRELLFRRHGLDSAAAWRRARPTAAPETFGDVFLIIDGWGALREDDLDLEDVLTAIASRGPALAVHTVLSVVSPAQVRVRLAANFGGRIELRLGDPFDSAVDRQLAAEVPKDVPGRALLANRHYAQVALPRIDGGSGLDDLPAATAELIAQANRKWPTGRVASVEVLPELVDGAALRHLAPAAPGLMIGLSERDLGPARVSLFGPEPHLIVYGDPQTGKTALLRMLLGEMVAKAGPERIGIVLVDYRRSHLGVVPDEYLVSYCTSPQSTAQTAAELAGRVRERIPGPEVTAAQLRERSWWRGLEIVVVVDDYDLVATPSANPLVPLAELLTQGHDLGLHVVLARRTGGASRFQFEPVIQTLNDMSTPGLLFSGDRMEGRLIGGVVSQRLPVGRALYARRGQPPEQVQVAWTPEPT
jgi:DNA segregation ATPase FtsK/SpoIIIE, S-DNA-T family